MCFVFATTALRGGSGLLRQACGLMQRTGPLRRLVGKSRVRMPSKELSLDVLAVHSDIEQSEREPARTSSHGLERWRVALDLGPALVEVLKRPGKA